MRQVPTCRGKRTVGPRPARGMAPKGTHWRAMAWAGALSPATLWAPPAFAPCSASMTVPLPTSSSQHLRRMSSWAVPGSARACVLPAVGCTAPAPLRAGARGTTSLRGPCGSCKGRGGCREVRKRLEKPVRDQQRWPSSLEEAGVGPGGARGGSGYQGDAAGLGAMRRGGLAEAEGSRGGVEAGGCAMM